MNEFYVQRKGIEYENAKKDEEETKIRLEELERRLNKLEKGDTSEEGSGYTDLVNAVSEND